MRIKSIMLLLGLVLIPIGGVFAADPAPTAAAPAAATTPVAAVPAAAPAAPQAVELNESLLFTEITKVTSSGFFEEKKNLAPGSIFIITPSMLTDYPVKTLQNVWDSFIPGVAAGAEHVHLGPHFDVRGAQSPIDVATLYMMNGNSFTDRLFTGYQWGQYCPLLGDIDHIEVILGPGSLTQGSGAMMGYVNEIQKNGKDNPGFLGSVDFGTPNRLGQAEASYGKKIDENQEFFIYEGMVEAEGSNFKDDFGNFFDGSAGRVPYPELGNQMAEQIKPSFRVSTNYRYGTFKFSGFFQDFSSSTDSLNTDDTPDGLRRDTVAMAAPEYTFNFNDNNSLQVIPSFIMHDTIRHRLITPDLIASGNVAPGSAPFTFEDAGAASTLVRGKAIFRTTSLGNQKLAAGIDYSVSKFYLGSSLMDPSVNVNYEGLSGNWTESSIFVEDVCPITEKLQASAGVRFDQVTYGSFDAYGMDFTPDSQANPSGRVAAAYEINDSNSAKFSISQGFTYATPGQLQYWGQCDALSIQAGYGAIPAIKPAQETSYEVNYHNDMKDIKLGTDVNLYINKMIDWIGFGDGATQLSNPDQIAYLKANSRLQGSHWLNIPETTDVGGEVMFKYAPFNNTLLGVGYAYSQPYHSETGKDVYGDYPTHQIKANLKLLFFEKLTFTGDAIVENSAPLDFSIAAPGSFYQDSALVDPRFVLNLRLDYKLNDIWSVNLTGMNVTENDNMAMAMGKGYLNRDQRYLYLGLKFKM